MGISRRADLQDFLDALKAAFAVPVETAPRDKAFVEELFGALEDPVPEGEGRPSQLPALSHLPGALRSAQSASAHVARLADSFAVLAPRLGWKVRNTSGPHASENWADGHANAVIVGPGGIEEREDVIVGVSLLAPHVRYPDHNHPPEELYLIMTSGLFQHGEESWVSLGPGETFHNPPAILHAMASGEEPLLAVWTLIGR